VGGHQGVTDVEAKPYVGLVDLAGTHERIRLRGVLDLLGGLGRYVDGRNPAWS
jgi:hypothetical protein